MKLSILFSLLVLTTSMSSQTADYTKLLTKDDSEDRIQVLNFGTFHMSYSTDLNTTEFDENDKGNQAEVHAIAEALATFRPTVILVERTPAYDSILHATYHQYVATPDMTIKNPSEIELLAFELGRLSGTSRIYGIDHKMSYNYQINNEITNTLDEETYRVFYNNPSVTFPFLAVDEDNLTVKEKLIGINADRYLDFLITVNADMLTHVSTESNFEGADEAAKYYQRNLRMYSNMNRIDLTPEDRVFLLMGASHTAFFRDFISRSPKYHMVDVRQYLK